MLVKNFLSYIAVFSNKKRLILASLALLQTIVLLCSVTFSWVEGTKDGKVVQENITVTAGSGIIFTGDNVNQDGAIEIEDTTLLDCSSTDGRNFYFPTTKSIGHQTTGNRKFRSGNGIDINKNYISKDFNVYSLAASGEKSKIYIGNASTISAGSGVSPDLLKAIRISVNLNDGSDPAVICPGYQKQTSTEISDAIESISADGTATTKSVKSRPLSYYWYNPTGDGYPVATINGGDSKRITVSIWLEGTDSNCSTAICDLKNIRINLVLTSGASYTKKVTFVDYSPNTWVKTDNVNVYAIDKSSVSGTDYTKGTAYLMARQSDNRTYVAYLPENVEDVVFGRFDPDNEDVAHNFWGTDSSEKMADSDINTYYGIGQGKEVDSKNYGYWASSDNTEMIDVYFTDSEFGSFVVYNTQTGEITNPNIYFYFDNGTSIKSFPGFNTSYHKQDPISNRGIYHVIIPASAKGIVISGNGQQTSDISLSDVTRVGTVTKIGYYVASNSKDGYGHWNDIKKYYEIP